MKKVVFSLMFVSIGFISQFTAQEVSPRKPHPKDRISEELNLSDEQKSKIKDLRVNSQVKKEEILKNESLSKEEKMTKIKEIQEQQKGDLKNVLTSEQQKKLNEIKIETKKLRELNKSTPQYRHGDQRHLYFKKNNQRLKINSNLEPLKMISIEELASEKTEKMKVDLELSKKQLSKVDHLNKEYFTKFKEAKTMSKEASKQAIKTAKNDYIESLKKIISKDQYIKYLEQKHQK